MTKHAPRLHGTELERSSQKYLRQLRAIDPHRSPEFEKFDAALHGLELTLHAIGEARRSQVMARLDLIPLGKSVSLFRSEWPLWAPDRVGTQGVKFHGLCFGWDDQKSRLKIRVHGTEDLIGTPIETVKPFLFEQLEGVLRRHPALVRTLNQASEELTRSVAVAVAQQRADARKGV